ncbi:MAG: magnesium transporter, partial [Gammaproteobacteria bacterium]|nr:magnesium transporter [Gammaproteobacteria bacterium]
PATAGALLPHLAPAQAVALLGGMSPSRREEVLRHMSAVEAAELRRLLDYPPASAGRLRDPRIAVFGATTSVRNALERMRATHRGRSIFNLFVVDGAGRLVGAVPLYRAALADPESTLGSLVQGPPARVSAFATQAEVVETMKRSKLTSLAVVDIGEVPIGVLQLNQLMPEFEEEYSADLVSVTGAGKDEGALSSAGFAVRKRLPWLLINLGTAFLAAAVVGLFENTIARFTALAVLLPVVAGQSGNSGSQALAVVLRGLALREITLHYWPRVAVKELSAGVLNGIGVGVVTCAGVYLWSQSVGLVLVIGAAMVLSMAMAGLAGAVIPVLLAALGKDPAQSSSILLTTVTDVVGFFSFLGLATLLSALI